MDWKSKTSAISKVIIPAISVIIILAIGYFILTIEAGMPVSSSVFAETLADANRVYIIMDLRGADELTKRAIMQCGIDFASSPALGNKNITTFALEGDTCTTMEGLRDVSSCLDESKSGPLIFIQQGNNSTFYRNKVIVGVGPDYKLGMCSITAK